MVGVLFMAIVGFFILAALFMVTYNRLGVKFNLPLFGYVDSMAIIVLLAIVGSLLFKSYCG